REPAGADRGDAQADRDEQSGRWQRRGDHGACGNQQRDARHAGTLARARAGWERRAGVLHAWAMSDDIRAGFCAIVGLPNVGKSTLLNRILDRHLVAVSAKPQTTRDRIVGVHTVTLDGDGEPIPAQIAYVDTPGVQDGRGPLRRYMRDAAIAAAADADVVLLLVDAMDRRGRMPERHAEADVAALGDASRNHPIVIGLNKVDRVAKPELLPVIEAWSSFAPGVEVVPISA